MIPKNRRLITKLLLEMVRANSSTLAKPSRKRNPKISNNENVADIAPNL